MRFLFFFVHPSKFHVFRITINELKRRGHHVEVLITSKDVLEDLVKSEGWDYSNIFPEGRKIDGLPPYISSGINTFRTVHRLYKYTKKRKFDLFITDDLLVYLGWLFRIPTIVFTDDDLSITKQFALILSPATNILAPEITDLQKYNSKKIGFPGYKELAYLHPNVFHPDRKHLTFLNSYDKKFFIIRLVSLRSYHDVGKKGISDIQVSGLISILEQKGKVFISTERPLPKNLEKYRIKIDPNHILHALAFAEIFIGDSQTMTSEAAVLGTPTIRCNDFVGKINVMEEKEIKYGLSFNFLPLDYEKLLEKVKEILEDETYRAKFQKRRDAMLKDKIDLSAFMIWLFENYTELDFNSQFDFERFKIT
jgi:predicted glycosyltransferase